MEVDPFGMKFLQFGIRFDPFRMILDGGMILC